MYRRLPQLESLRVFEASARHANFSRAAEELGVTPAAVSLRVRDLESDLGQRLFVRNGPRIALTEAGTELALRLGEVMALTRAAVAACRATETPLRVTVTPTFAARWLTPRLPRYHALHDAARIRLDVSTDLRSADQFDVAIRSGAGDWPGLAATPLFPLEQTPMLSAALARTLSLRTPADLEQVPLIPDENWTIWFREAGVANPRLDYSPVEYQTQEMAAGAALEGIGAALLSPVLFAAPLAEGALVRPFAQTVPGPGAYHVLRHGADHRLSVDHFVEWLCAEAHAESGPSPLVPAPSRL